MRNLVIDGRLGKDATMEKTKDGRTYLRFAIANNYYNNLILFFWLLLLYKLCYIKFKIFQ